MSAYRTIVAGVLGVFVVAGVSACVPQSPAPAPVSTPAASPVSAPALAAAPAAGLAGDPGPTGDVQPVTRVVDGDTFDTPAGRVRVLVMDSCESGTAGGRQATAQAHELLEGQRVTLTTETGVDKDGREGRLLRYVTLSDGTDYAEAMLPADHSAVHAGHNDASPERVAQGRAHDPNGRTCGDDQPTTTRAVAPAADDDSDASRPDRPAPRVSAPRTHAPTKARTGHSGHPCVGNERDGDGDGYCGEGK